MGSADEEIAAGVKHIDEPAAGTEERHRADLILLRIGDKNLVVEISDAEGAVSSGKT